jgi:hypothetical protein
MHKACAFVLLVTALAMPARAVAYDPVDCLGDIAKADPKIIMGLATKLCSGSWSPEPVKCYILVPDVDNEIPRGIATKNTVSCYRKAWVDGHLIRAQATTLCGAKKQEREP